MMLALQVKDQYAGSSNDLAYRLAQQVAARSNNNGTSDYSDHSNSRPGSAYSANDDLGSLSDSSSLSETKQDLQSTVIAFLASLDEKAPGSLRRSGAINRPNAVQQTLLHVATVMGYQRLVRRLVLIGAHLDLQDVNGYTALGLASLMGKTSCVRVLIEAGASYDRPTAFGEMPLDLAKVGEHSAVEALLLSAVWSTTPESLPTDSSPSLDTSSGVDEDNPSSEDSDVEQVSQILLHRRSSRKTKGKRPIAMQPLKNGQTTSPRRNSTSRSRRSSLSSTPHPTPLVSHSTPPEAPPPYDGTLAHPPAELAPWMSNLYPGAFKLPGAVWDRIPQPITALFDKALPLSSTASSSADSASDPNDHGHGSHGWVAFPAPSWETLQKMASPEEVKLFTQAMAAAAFNAVVQSGATTSSISVSASGPARSRTDTEVFDSRARSTGRKKKSKGERETGSPGSPGSPPSPGSPAQVVTHVKRKFLFLHLS